MEALQLQAIPASASLQLPDSPCKPPAPVNAYQVTLSAVNRMLRARSTVPKLRQNPTYSISSSYPWAKSRFPDLLETLAVRRKGWSGWSRGLYAQGRRVRSIARQESGPNRSFLIREERFVDCGITVPQILFWLPKLTSSTVSVFWFYATYWKQRITGRFPLNGRL